MDLPDSFKSQTAPPDFGRIPVAFLEELGKLIGSYLAERERKQRALDEQASQFSIDQRHSTEE